MPNELTTQDILRKLFPGPQEAAQRDSSGQAWIHGPNRFALPRASQGFLERYRRPGDTTGFTPGANPEMEGLAADLGNRQSSWWEKVLAAAGLGTGIVQGKIRGGKPAAAPRELDKLGFYSQALEAAKGLQRKSGPAQGFLNDLTKAGVKKAELQATGLDKWLEKRADAQAPVNREELVEFLRANRVQVQETGYGAQSAKDKAAMKAEWAPLVAERERLVEERGPPLQGPLLELRISPEARARHQRVSELNQQINAIKDKYKIGDIRWKRAGGQNLLLDPDNPSNRESVVHMPLAQRQLEMGEMRPFGRDYPGVSDAGQAMWEGRNLVNGVTEAPWRIGEQSGRVTYWPETFRHFNGDMNAPGGPKYVVNSPNMQNAHFKTLEEAKATIERSYHSAASPSYMGYHRQDSYREPHFPSVPNYLFHLRTGMYRDAQGRQVLLGDEAQSTRAQGIRESEAGPRDEAKIAELQKRWQEASDKYQAALAEGQEYASQHGHTIADKLPRDLSAYDATSVLNTIYTDGPRDISTQAFSLSNKMYNAANDARLLSAELKAASDAPSGHPLVNTMNQVDTTMLRRLIQQAVESKAEGLALTPGDLQNERYSLSKHVGGLRYNPDTGGLQMRPVEANWRRGDPDPSNWYAIPNLDRSVKPEELPGVVGVEMAKALLARPRSGTGGGAYGGWHELPDLGSVEIGGQGMREYYDKTYPNVIEKELRRLDPQWPGRETTDIPHDAGRQHVPPNKFEDAPQKGPFHYFPITPKIQEEVAKGLPLFSAAALAPLLGNLFPRNDRVEVTEENPFDYAP